MGFMLPMIYVQVKNYQLLIIYRQSEFGSDGQESYKECSNDIDNGECIRLRRSENDISSWRFGRTNLYASREGFEEHDKENMVCKLKKSL